MLEIASDSLAVLPWLLGCMVGVLLTTVRLPGNWLIVAEALLYGWMTEWEDVGAWLIAILVGIAVVGEVLEMLMSVFTARRAGASGRAAWGGLIGGFLGMLMLSFLVPIPVVGTMVGALVGCFGGAMIGELSVKRELVQGTRVGVFSAVGFVLGTVAKLGVAFVLAAIVLTTVIAGRLDSPPVGESQPVRTLPEANASG